MEAEKGDRRDRAQATNSKRSASLYRGNCDSLCVLIKDSSQFGVAERGLWHYTNIGSSLPRKLWRERDGISILSTTAKRLSVIGGDATGGGGNAPKSSPAAAQLQLRMSASTATRFVYYKYRVVFAIDLSPSLFTLDSHSGRVLADDAIKSIATVAAGLVAPMQCAPSQAESRWYQPYLEEALLSSTARTNENRDGGHAADATSAHVRAHEGIPSVWFSPEVHVSVVAQEAVATGSAAGASSATNGSLHPHVLLHGFSLTADSLPDFISRVTAGLRAVETAHASQTNDATSTPPTASSCAPSVAPLLESSVGMLKLLPSDACPAVVLVTDCVAGLPPSSDYGSVVMQMLRHDIVTHVLQLGTCSGVHSALGCVPDTESMQFLATATGGFRVRQRDLSEFVRPVLRPGPPPREESNDYAIDGLRSKRSESMSAAADGEKQADGRPLTSRKHRSHAPAFTTAYWSKLQQQMFVRTSVLSVQPRPVGDPAGANRDEVVASAVSGVAKAVAADGSMDGERSGEVSLAAAPFRPSLSISAHHPSSTAAGIGSDAALRGRSTPTPKSGVASPSALIQSHRADIHALAASAIMAPQSPSTNGPGLIRSPSKLGFSGSASASMTSMGRTPSKRRLEASFDSVAAEASGAGSEAAADDDARRHLAQLRINPSVTESGGAVQGEMSPFALRTPLPEERPATSPMKSATASAAATPAPHNSEPGIPTRAPLHPALARLQPQQHQPQELRHISTPLLLAATSFASAPVSRGGARASQQQQQASNGPSAPAAAARIGAPAKSEAEVAAVAENATSRPSSSGSEPETPEPDAWLRQAPTWADDEEGLGGSAAATTSGSLGGGVMPAAHHHALSSASFAFPWHGPPPPVLVVRKRVRSYRLRAEPRMLMECRLKEGFRVIMSNSTGSGSSGMPQMQLMLVWQPQVMIIYSITSQQSAADVSRRNRSAQPASSTSSRRRAAEPAPASYDPPSARVSIDVVGRQDFISLYERVLELQAQQQKRAGEAPAAAAGTDAPALSGQLARLSKDAVEPHRVQALLHFLSVTEQVDRVLVHLCGLSALLSPVDSSNNGGGSQVPSLPVVSQGGSMAAAPAPATNLTLPPQLRLLLTPLGSLSIAAWHRWFDVERLEVVLAPGWNPYLLSQRLLGLAPSDDSTSDSTASAAASAVNSNSQLPDLFASVTSALAAWSDASLPRSTEAFAMQREMSVAAAEGDSFCNGIGGEAGDSAPYVKLFLPPPTVSSDVSAGARDLPQEGKKAASKRGSSSAVRAESAAGSGSASTAAGDGNAGLSTSAKESVSFAIARATRYVGQPSSAHQSGSALVIVHVAFFSCLPPVRAAHLAHLRQLLTSPLHAAPAGAAEESVCSTTPSASAAGSVATHCPLSRVLVQAAGVAQRSLETTSSTLLFAEYEPPASPAGSNNSYDSERLSESRLLSASICCGGTPVPARLLTAALRHKQWRWSVVLGGIEAVASAARDLWLKLLAARLGPAIASQSAAESIASDTTATICPDQPWTLVSWQTGVSASGTDSGHKWRAHFAKVISLSVPLPAAAAVVSAGTPRPPTPSAVAFSSRSGHIIGDRRCCSTQTCIVQQVVQVAAAAPTAPAASDKLVVTVDFWMEPQEGFVAISNTDGSDSSSGSAARSVTTAGLFSALCAATHSVDGRIVTSFALRQHISVPEAAEGATSANVSKVALDISSQSQCEATALVNSAPFSSISGNRAAPPVCMRQGHHDSSSRGMEAGTTSCVFATATSIRLPPIRQLLACLPDELKPRR